MKSDGEKCLWRLVESINVREVKMRRLRACGGFEETAEMKLLFLEFLYDHLLLSSI